MRCLPATKLGHGGRLDLALLLHGVEHGTGVHVVRVSQRTGSTARARQHRLDEHRDQEVVADVVAGGGEKRRAGCQLWKPSLPVGYLQVDHCA